MHRIRTLSNLLLALASDLEPCRPFLAKYANHCINLPSDWLEVIKLYRVLKGQKPRDNIRLPRKLRLALVTKFKTFSEYSLAKYNNTKRKKKEGDLTPTIKAMVRVSVTRKCVFTVARVCVCVIFASNFFISHDYSSDTPFVCR